MKTVIALMACTLAASVAAQETKTEPQKPRPALNLRLDDANSAAPRVTFGPPASAQTKEEREKGLPEMGGKPNSAYTRQVAPSGGANMPSNSVIPSAMDPNFNRGE